MCGRFAFVNEPKPGKVFGTASHVIPPSWMFLGGQYMLQELPSINRYRRWVYTTKDISIS